MLANAIIYTVLTVMAVWCHLKTMLSEPGVVPREALPLRDESEDGAAAANHTLCGRCESYKPTRLVRFDRSRYDPDFDRKPVICHLLPRGVVWKVQIMITTRNSTYILMSLYGATPGPSTPRHPSADQQQIVCWLCKQTLTLPDPPLSPLGFPKDAGLLCNRQGPDAPGKFADAPKCKIPPVLGLI